MSACECNATLFFWGGGPGGGSFGEARKEN